MRKAAFFLLAALVLDIPLAGAVQVPNVSLVLPADSYTSWMTNNVTFSCNATDDENIYSLSLYNDISGDFSLYATNRTMGIQNDSDALIICGFDNSTTCFSGETGTSSDLEFQETHMREGIYFNDESSTLYYPSLNNIGYAYGTIQMLIMPGFNPYEDEVYFFSTGGSNRNQIEMWNDYEILRFNFYDASGRLSTASVDISAWEERWYHVAAVWDFENLFGNGNAIDIFIDGSNQSVTRNVDYYQAGSFTQNMYIGSSTGGWGNLNSVVDEFGISGRPMSAQEINQTYLRMNGDHSYEAVNWTIANITDGLYTWNCMAYDNESQNAWYPSNHTLIVDYITPPSVVSVNMNPSLESAIDPGVVINITANITDMSNVSHAILMYKSPYSGIYTNDSMDYNTGTGLWENGSIVTNQDEGNWSYRFWSNDTWGHSATSDVYTVAVEKEFSWEIGIFNSSNEASQTIGPVSGFKETVKRMGMVSINNTGDYLTSFDFSSSFELNYNVSEPFDIPAGGTKDVEINITLPATANEYTVLMEISTTSIPSSVTVNGSAISYIGGPYINETTEITDYPSSVPQSTSANLTGYIKNIGNETASNVTLNWTLPSGWSISYGNLSQYIGDLSSYEISTVTITVSISSSAAAGIATVWLNSSCSEGSAGSDFKVIGVTCSNSDGVCGAGCSYSSDDDCEAPSGGGRTSGGSVTVPNADIEVTVPEKIEAKKGSSVSFPVSVKNIASSLTLNDLSISFSGLSHDIISSVPMKISSLKSGASATFTVTVTVPYFMEPGKYPFTVTVKSGTVRGLEKEAGIVLVVSDVSENETIKIMALAQKAIDEMSLSGFRTDKLRSYMNEADAFYERLEFDSAKALAEKVIDTRNMAFSISSLIQSLDGELSKAEGFWIDVSQSRLMSSLAESALQRGDYERANDRITAAVAAYNLEAAPLVSVASNIIDNWALISGIIALTLVTSLLARRRIMMAYLSGSIKKNEKTRNSIREGFREIQELYYDKRIISKNDFIARQNDFHERIGEMSADWLELRRKLQLMKSGFRGGKVERLRNDVNNMIKDVQREYFELKSITKTEYDKSLHILENEMAELETIKGRSEKSAAVLMIALLVLSVATVPVSAAENLTYEKVSAAISVAESTMADMAAMGFMTERVNLSIGNAKRFLAEGSLSSALAEARYVPVIKDKVIIADEALSRVEIRASEMKIEGYDTSGADILITDAFELFGLEDYEGAEEKVLLADSMLDEIIAAESLERASEGGIAASIYLMATERTTEFIYALSALLAVLIGTVISVLYIMKRRRRGVLEKEMNALKESMKSIQVKYFVEKSMSRKSYENALKRYRKHAENLSMKRLSLNIR